MVVEGGDGLDERPVEVIVIGGFGFFLTLAAEVDGDGFDGVLGGRGDIRGLGAIAVGGGLRERVGLVFKYRDGLYYGAVEVEVISLLGLLLRFVAGVEGDRLHGV